MTDFNASVYCPRCSRHTSLRVAPAKYNSTYETGYTGAVWNSGRGEWWIGICNNCEQPLLVLNNGQVVYPETVPSPTDHRIPEHIGLDLDEAKICFSAGAYRACAVMARRSIQSAAIQKGAGAGNLVSQINELETSGVITADLKDWATVVRWIGNDAAHPNEDSVEENDAKDILELAEQFLNVVFVTPALARERMAARNDQA